eukprot:COSAG06_NODE_66762_length_253_cov_1.194805_1_plen_29_part_10
MYVAHSAIWGRVAEHDLSGTNDDRIDRRV